MKNFSIVSVSDILKDHVKLFSYIIIKGWVRTKRDSKLGISFISIYDGSCLHNVQVLACSKLLNYFSEIVTLTSGCSIIVKGKLIPSKGKLQKYEIKSYDINVQGRIKHPEKYPISAKKHSYEYLRSVAHLRPRTNFISSIMRIRHTLSKSIHDFFDKNGYFWISTPILTSSDTEGASAMFRVSTLDINNNLSKKNIVDFKKDFFCKESFLTVSGQLNGEAYASALSKVYTFGPVFRAENSNTSRHLSEFWMIEPETAYANLADTINLAEKMIKYLLKKILDKRYEDIEYLNTLFEKNKILHLQNTIEKKFIQIEYNEAIKILNNSKKTFSNKVFWGIDFASEHERFLTEEYFKGPVIIKNYPKKIKSFYMRINDDNKTVASMDLLVPGIGEIIGGSQREERLQYLDKRIKEIGLNKNNYWWYRELRKYGTVVHSGFGLGFERLIAYITGVKNLKDVIPFPRTPKSINF